MAELRVESIDLVNVKCIEHARLRFRKLPPGQGELLVIAGDNGQGKTAIVEGISTLFAGGSRPELIRRGAERLEAKMVLSDGVTVTRTQTRKGSYLRIETENGQPVRAPQTYVEGLNASYAFDPLAFCSATPKQRLEFLLNTMPVRFSVEEVTGVIGEAATIVALPAAFPLDLNTLGVLQRDLVTQRQSIGGRQEERASSIETLRRALPPRGEKNPDRKAELARLDHERGEIEASEASAIDEMHARSNQVRNRFEEDIRQRMQALHEERIRLVADADTRLASDIALARGQFEGRKQELTAAMARAQQLLEEDIRTDELRQQLTRQQKECDLYAAQYSHIKAAVGGLEALRRSKLEHLPFPGLEIRDGIIYYDAIEFDNLNQARQYILAIEIGSQGLGNLGLMILDEGEHLGPGNWEVLRQAVEQSGMQVVVTRVEAGLLRSQPPEALLATI